jgi:hypothetical protein
MYWPLEVGVTSPGSSRLSCCSWYTRGHSVYLFHEEAQKARERVEARAELPKAEEVKSAPTKEKEGEVEGRFLEGTRS